MVSLGGLLDLPVPTDSAFSGLRGVVMVTGTGEGPPTGSEVEPATGATGTTGGGKAAGVGVGGVGTF